MKTIEIVEKIYIEDLRHFCNKWRKLFDEINYNNVSVTIANIQTGIEQELEDTEESEDID